MDIKKSGIRAVAVLALALAAGHLVQTMNEPPVEAKAKPSSVEQVSAGAKPAPAPTDAVLPVTAALGGTAPVPATAEPAITLPADKAAAGTAEVPPPVLAALPTPGSLPPTDPAPIALPELAKAATAEDAPLVKEAPAVVSAGDCKTDLALAKGPQAMISLTLTAPCRAGERIVLRHAGLAIAEMLPADGKLTLDLPALNAKGEVSVLFTDAEVAKGAIAVPEALSIKRFGIQWIADDAFQLHVLEGGADYNKPGHVWSEAPVSSNGGYMLALGNPTLSLPMMATVYTWPMDKMITADVMIESVVTEMTCGRELLGETLAMVDGSVTITDLTLAMPECDALGDILVLKNPGLDVTLAASN